MLTCIACLVCLSHVVYSNYRVNRVRRQWRELAYTNSVIAEEALFALVFGVNKGFSPRISELQTLAEKQLASTT